MTLNQFVSGLPDYWPELLRDFEFQLNDDSVVLRFSGSQIGESLIDVIYWLGHEELIRAATSMGISSVKLQSAGTEKSHEITPGSSAAISAFYRDIDYPQQIRHRDSLPLVADPTESPVDSLQLSG